MCYMVESVIQVVREVEIPGRPVIFAVLSECVAGGGGGGGL